MMTCKRCKNCPNRADFNTVCYFDSPSHNYQCQTLYLIRCLCYEGNVLPKGVDYQYCDDQKYATIKIDEVRCNGQFIGEALWVSWYKSRGRTDAVWILDSDDAPRTPTEEELLAIVSYYKKL